MKTDFSRWKDEDESGSESDGMEQDSSLQAMMQQMGGLGPGGMDAGPADLPGMDVSGRGEAVAEGGGKGGGRGVCALELVIYWLSYIP